MIIEVEHKQRLVLEAEEEQARASGGGEEPSETLEMFALMGPSMSGKEASRSTQEEVVPSAEETAEPDLGLGLPLPSVDATFNGDATAGDLIHRKE